MINNLFIQVIMYENAALAEALCHINQWDHCVIPLEALQVALKHRQLDTVAFFLKTQENGILEIFINLWVFTSTFFLPSCLPACLPARPPARPPSFLPSFPPSFVQQSSS
jgi:hypothetical protein